jgi:hypothetical protein
MCRYLFVLWAGLSVVGSVGAATWADALFDDLSRDFGSCPRGPVLTHPFRLTNTTRATVHIANVRASCGCTSATTSNDEVAPGQSTVILVQMDTRRFAGVKSVTIYVQLDRPQWEEVRLWVQANSRDDISFNPETIAFGQVKRGAPARAAVAISFLGNADWQIQSAACDSNYVQTEYQEVHRDTGEVRYQLTAHIRPDAPVGKWYTDVWLKTNDPASARVRVPLTVEVQSPLSINPTVAVLGQVKAGVETERRLILRGVKPFRVTSVDGTDAFLQVKDSTPASKPVHVLTVRLKADRPGEWNRTLRVHTDLKEDGDIEVQARAHVVP